MRLSAKLFVFFSLLAVLAPGVAGAHTLKASRAAKANKTFARILCSASNDAETSCVDSKSGGCKRISDHRMRCALYITLESKKDKSQVRCRALMEWVLDNDDGGITPDFLGIKSCVQVRPPESEPVP
jgi:hypothetical protein